MLIARIILTHYSHATDRLFDYSIPENLVSQVKVGSRVIVPFGKSDKEYEAFVLFLVSQSEYGELKSIKSVIDNINYFGKNEVDLIEFMRHRYFCSYISAIRCLVPAGLGTVINEYVSLNRDKYEQAKEYCKRSKTGDKIISCLNAYGTMSLETLKLEIGANNFGRMIKQLESEEFINISTKCNEKISDTLKTYVELAVERFEAYELIDSIYKKAPARARVLEIVCENFEIELSELIMYAQTSKKTVDALVSCGYLSYRKVVCNDTPASKAHITPIVSRPNLTKQQSDALSELTKGLKSGNKSSYLLHGVTGSGKTEVYLSLIEETIKLGRDAIMLVPEISLTPQMISQILSRFGDNVAVLHSKLTLKQRYNEWKRIKNSQVRIAVGARSAVFAPFKNTGLIIVDEEHETTYKSEMSPRYNALEIARFLIGRSNGVLLLASATPSIDSYYKATQGVFRLLRMTDRISKSGLPAVHIADMRSEIADGNMSIFSKELQKSIKSALDKKEQIILFLNRRGFSGFVSCRDCGYVMLCPNCNVSLTYHKFVDKMVCHYCDYKTVVKKSCPKCNSGHIRFFGIGTEKVTEELANLFPKARVLRMDADTTAGRMGHENILNHFKNGDADILVGTQMITKGLDFANVTLVGVMAADMSLNMDDYRAGERTFDLITQVIGRAGRAYKSGRAIIQTYNPDDDTIILSSKQDYNAFYDEEIAIRRMLLYPPFTEFIKIQFSGINRQALRQCAEKFRKDVMELLDDDFFGDIYKVSEAPVFKVNGKYRYRFMMKTPYKKKTYDILHNVYDKYLHVRDISITIDVNPISTN